MRADARAHARATIRFHKTRPTGAVLRCDRAPSDSKSTHRPRVLGEELCVVFYIAGRVRSQTSRSPLAEGGRARNSCVRAVSARLSRVCVSQRRFSVRLNSVRFLRLVRPAIARTCKRCTTFDGDFSDVQCPLTHAHRGGNRARARSLSRLRSLGCCGRASIGRVIG